MYLKLNLKFSLNKEELHNRQWAKLYCNLPLSANALNSSLKSAFYFSTYFHTFRWRHMDSIASWRDSSLKSKCWQNEGFDEIMLSYAYHSDSHHMSLQQWPACGNHISLSFSFIANGKLCTLHISLLRCQEDVYLCLQHCFLVFSSGMRTERGL